ncbi:MAG TPA: alpha/beta hydrolase [Steroidobacteraceae bacterium]|nr:alpha/beta hydrolase [Steroidobacteraceae bacterium]
MVLRALSVLILHASILLLAGCRTTEFLLANAPAGFEHVSRHLNLPYGKDPRQRLDIYTPRRSVKRTVVIFWYGGSWTQGNKADYRFVGATLASHGLVGVLPDYRLYPEVTFPGFEEDGAQAVAWVEQHIGEFGGDPTRIVLMGHSAGAHTAAFLAYDHAFLSRFGASPRAIIGLVGLSGPYVLAPDTPTLHAAFPPRYTEKDWRPIAFVDSQAPPSLLLHGADDDDVPAREAVELRDALLREHVRVELRLYPHRGHGDTVASFAAVARWRTSAVNDTIEFIDSLASAH